MASSEPMTATESGQIEEDMLTFESYLQKKHSVGTISWKSDSLFWTCSLVLLYEHNTIKVKVKTARFNLIWFICITLFWDNSMFWTFPPILV